MSVGSGGSEEAGERPGQGRGLGAEISRRVVSILDAVEAEAARIRADANAEAEAELAQARQQADELVQQRRTRIAELSDELVAKTEAILGRLDDAEPIYQRFERLIRALGDAAEKLAAETEVDPSEPRREARPPFPEPPSGPAAADRESRRPSQTTDNAYVPPRSSSFWRATRSGAAQPPPGPLPPAPSPHRSAPDPPEGARGFGSRRDRT